MAGEITILGVSDSVCRISLTLFGQTMPAGNKTITLLGQNRAIVCAVEPISVDIYGSPMVTMGDDGSMYWCITISTSPDVNYDTGMSISGYLNFSDDSGGPYAGRIEQGDDARFVTTIPYREGIEYPSYATLDCALDNPNYVIGNVSMGYGRSAMGLDE